MASPAAEKAARAHLGTQTFVNGNVNSSTPVANNSTLETALSLNGLTAKVLVRQGTACKVKWYNSTGKPVTSYYARKFVQADAVTFINAFMA